RVPPIKGGVEGSLLGADAMAKRYPHDRADFARGGHGLFSILADYATFARALLTDAGGGGVPRLLATATLAHMTANHAAAAMPISIELPAPSVNPGLQGQGFGLGFAVAQPGGPLTARPGAFGWSGAAETWFNVDPESNLFMVFMGQNFDWPGGSFDLQNMAYAALTA
ncbi:MAG: serine hydrolase, partial [Pseudomonadota bacterium]